LEVDNRRAHSGRAFALSRKTAVAVVLFDGSL
jgi:hypothetical protein